MVKFVLLSFTTRAPLGSPQQHVSITLGQGAFRAQKFGDLRHGDVLPLT